MSLIGKTAIAWRGVPMKCPILKTTTTELQFILYDDEETIMELQEQNPYDYHDCADDARLIKVYRDKKMWQHIKKSSDFAEPTVFPW